MLLVEAQILRFVEESCAVTFISHLTLNVIYTVKLVACICYPKELFT